MSTLLDTNKCNSLLAITISPPNRIDKYNSLDYIYKSDALYIDKYLRKCSIFYTIYPELDISGRLHYHGIITLKDRVKFYRAVLPAFNLLGFTLVKAVFEESKWLKYITKDWETTQKILKITDYIHWEKRTKPKKTPIKDENNKLIGYGFLIEEDSEEYELSLAESRASV